MDKKSNDFINELLIYIIDLNAEKYNKYIF